MKEEDEGIVKGRIGCLPEVEYNNVISELTYSSLNLRTSAISRPTSAKPSTVAQGRGPAIISHPEYYEYTIGENAWWRMDLYPTILEEMAEAGQLEGFDMIEPEAATREEIEAVHDPEYIDTVLGTEELPPPLIKPYLLLRIPHEVLNDPSGLSEAQQFLEYALGYVDSYDFELELPTGGVFIYFDTEEARARARNELQELLDEWRHETGTDFIVGEGEKERPPTALDYPAGHAKYVWSGGPWDESAKQAVLRAAGGMIRANEEALGRGMSIQLYDAFHHAMPEAGQDVCVINDVAMAALKYSNMGHRIMIVDTDTHQGNGTAVCTEGDPNIYTLSTHEFHMGAESSLDIQVSSGISDDGYLTLLNNGIQKALSEFGTPDLVMYIAGTDMYGGDKLSHTRVTTEGIRLRDELVFKIFGQMGVPVATSIPQGYAEDPEDTARLIKNTMLEVEKGWDEYYQGYQRTVTSSDNDKISLALSRQVIT